jgi:hypothetical protein
LEDVIIYIYLLLFIYFVVYCIFFFLSSSFDLLFKITYLGSSWSYKEEPMRDPTEMWAEEEKLTLEQRRERYLCRDYTPIKDVCLFVFICFYVCLFMCFPRERDYTTIEMYVYYICLFMFFVFVVFIFLFLFLFIYF